MIVPWGIERHWDGTWQTLSRPAPLFCPFKVLRYWGQGGWLQQVDHRWVDQQDYHEGSNQKQFQYILSQQEAKLNYDKLNKICDDIMTKISAISENSIVQKEKATRKKHIKARDTLRKKIVSIVNKAFTLYQQMSGPALRAEWDDTVQDHCFTIGWAKINGTISAEQQGQDWLTLAKCKRLHLLTVCDKDAAERGDNYKNIHVGEGNTGWSSEGA